MRQSLYAILMVFAPVVPAGAQPAPPVHVPPLEVAAGVSVEHKAAVAVVAISGNVTNIFALTSEVGRAEDGVAVLGGARVSTGFWYDGRPPMPGRFFAQLLAGRQSGSAVAEGTLLQAGVGADVIVLPRRAVSLHWSLDYRSVLGRPPYRSGARLVIGIVLGPRT